MLGKALKGLERISKPLGYIPILLSGGGNTVKVDHELMLIKAPGYSWPRWLQMTALWLLITGMS